MQLIICVIKKFIVQLTPNERSLCFEASLVRLFIHSSFLVQAAVIMQPCNVKN
jgi:hypothetical protein